MKQCAVVACLLLLVCIGAVAQAPPKAPANQPPPSAQPPPPPSAQPAGKPADKDAKPAEKKEASPAPEPPEEPKGDIVTLKSGKLISNVQVITRSPAYIELDVGDGITMKIPRNQISSIKYDKIEPVKPKKATAEESDAKTGDLIQGSKITAEISAKLTAPIPEPPLKYENQDLIVIMDELSKRLGITIIVDDPVKALPDKERIWSFQSTPDTTLMSLLQDSLLKSFVNLGVVYQYDKLLVTTKDAADTIAAKEVQSDDKPAAEKPAPENPKP